MASLALPPNEFISGAALPPKPAAFLTGRHRHTQHTISRTHAYTNTHPHKQSMTRRHRHRHRHTQFHACTHQHPPTQTIYDRATQTQTHTISRMHTPTPTHEKCTPAPSDKAYLAIACLVFCKGHLRLCLGVVLPPKRATSATANFHHQFYQGGMQSSHEILHGAKTPHQAPHDV
jgi:hypothetical protein